MDSKGQDVLFKGAITELLTPFTPKGEVDSELLGGEVQFQIKEGIGGLFVNGLASECLIMDLGQRIEAAKVTVSNAQKKVPVMGNIACNILTEALKLLEAYEDLGLDAVAITQPMVYPYPPNGVFQFLKEIIERSKLPVYIYNAPQSGYVLSPSFLARLFTNFKNVKGYKDSTQDIIHLQTLIREIGKERNLEIFAGSDATILPTLHLGGAGVISLVSTVFPKVVIDLCEAFFKGNFPLAQEIQFKILRIREILKIGPFMAGYKFVSGLIGNSVGTMKIPLKDLSEEERDKIRKGLAQEGLI
ncbi:MAG: dihydrodipicolinate synthase family protein [Caldiserica bacterium]|nr:dihydrodipicolinate synthase family protein [Caldisericota bacterium]MDH7563238.1 dihydrodipicolinate synthase family protein [Caldisericota bacterium]